MYTVSQDFLDYINNPSNIGRTIQNKVVIDSVEYLSDKLKTNPAISHEATSFIGGFYSKTCEFEILNLDGTLNLNNKEVTVYKGLLINDSIEWVKMGIFKALDPNITNNESSKSIKFLGNDRAILFDIPYESDLDWSTSHTGLEIAQESCTKLGVTLETTDFAFANYSFTSKPNFVEDTTYREVIGRLAEIGGEIAYISRDGGLRIQAQSKTNKNMLDPTTLIDGYVLNTGKFSTSHPYDEMRSGFIKVKPNTKYTFSIIETSSNFQRWIGICQYSGNDVADFISPRVDQYDVSSKTITTTENTQYIVVSGRNLKHATKVLLEESPKETSFQPYEEKTTKNLVHLMDYGNTLIGMKTSIINQIWSISGTATSSWFSIGSQNSALNIPKVESNEDYTITVISTFPEAHVISFWFDDINGAQVVAKNITAGANRTTTTTFTFTGNVEDVVRFRLAISGFSNGSTYNGTLKIQLEKGTIATNYEKFGGAVIIGKEKRISLTKEPKFGAINTVALGKAGIDDDIIYPATIEDERITWRIEDNPYVDLIREDIIEDVASHIIGMNVIPYTIDGFIDDFIYDLNDVISVYDNNENVFEAVILNYKTKNRMRSDVGADSQTEKLVDHDIAGSTKNAISRVSVKVDHNEQQIELLAQKTEDLEDEIVESTTTILQNAESIIMSALQDYVTTGDFETYQQVISTQFEQTSQSFQFTFNNIINQINDLNTNLQEETNERIKYIRFEDGDIIIGVAGNDLILKQSNDRISFLQGDNEVAYFSNNKLYVTDGEFLNSLKIGRFMWKPRENGNLSLVYVGGDN